MDRIGSDDKISVPKKDERLRTPNRLSFASPSQKTNIGDMCHVILFCGVFPKNGYAAAAQQTPVSGSVQLD